MDIEVMVEGEGLAEIEIIRIPEGGKAREIVAAVALRSGFPAEEGILFIEDGNDPLDLALVIVEEAVTGKVHHVHRALHVEVSVLYQNEKKEKQFPPSARVQRVLDWAVGRDGFKIDPAIAPEMELALHGQTTPLPKNAHIGRYVRHHHHSLTLDLIRGVVPNGVLL
jgi:hypothetical protein